MRYLISIFLVFSLGCSDSKRRSLNSDEVKNIEVSEILCNSIMLDEDKIVACINCEKIGLRNSKELSVLLKQKKATLVNRLFYIVCSSSTNTKVQMQIAEILEASDIEEVRIVKLEDLFVSNVIPLKLQDD
jgi:hypothetical protein